MNIDIICPLYNAEKYILHLNKSLLMQKNVEINKIVYILTESNDNTEKILIDNNIEHKKILENEFSHSLTREKAAFDSSADIVVFITQDIIIEKDNWLYFLIKDIEQGNCEAAYSRQVCNNSSIEKYTRELNYPNESKYMSKEYIEEYQLRTFFFSDASSAIRRDVFCQLNGYDNKNLPISEDMYVAYKLIMNGCKIKYCADSEVIHSHDFTLKQLYNRYKLTGQFFKQNSYLNKYKVNNSGLGMAKYVFKRILQERNIKAFVKFVPNISARFVGLKVGKM